MGSGRPGSLLLASISDLIKSPYVLFGAAAVVVIAVLIVLIMVLRGGSKKDQLASEYDEDQGAWDSTPRGAVGQPDRDYNQQDQAFPWQGGARADAGRQAAGGRRGPAGRDAQGAWDQPDDYAQQNAQWDAPAQPASRGGQWAGTDDWGAVPAMDRGNNQRPPQGEWGRGPASSPAPGRGQDQWGQNPPAQGRDQDQWGQPAQNDWGQPAANRGREQDQWGQPAQSEWGQPASARGRDQDQWGQPAQNDWGQQPPAVARGMDQPEAGARRGPDSSNRVEGQWGQGNWAGGNAAWDEPAAGDRWGQPQQPAQSSRPAQSGPGRPLSQPSTGDAGNDWGQPRVDRPAASASRPADGAWDQREAPAWQPAPQQDPPMWQSSGWKPAEPESAAPRGGQRGQSGSSAQWGPSGQSSAEDDWGAPGGAGEWGQPVQPRSNASRPIASANAPGAGQPPSSGTAGDEWGKRDFDGPTVRPGQSAPSRDSREASSWSSGQDSAAPAWQGPSSPQMGAAAYVAGAPVERRQPDMRQISKMNPETTAYAPPAPGSDEGEAAKTVVVRKDAGGERMPAIVVRQGKEPGRSYDMRKEHISIGRSRESDIFLEDLAVSRLHATIYRDEMGGYRLRDEHSANGTSVNGQRISEAVLQEGDEIQLGQTILAFMRR